MRFRVFQHPASVSTAVRLACLLLFIPKGHAGEVPTSLDDVSGFAEKAIAENGAPALALAAVVDGKIRAAGIAGVRKAGDETIGKAELGDRFHLGSLTKSFTATLAATLVEEGRLRWESKTAEILRLPKLHPGFENLTLEHLLSNTGGLPKKVPNPIWKRAWGARGNLATVRLDFARAMLEREPLFAPGTKYTYSNTGYSIAGVMLESRAREPWESLIRKRIFAPLEMGSAGFRAPAADPSDSTETRDQPWGHRSNGLPVPPEPFGDNPASIAPAGAIHGSILDLAKYARFHLLAKPEPVLKKTESFEALHAARLNDYALGWAISKKPWTESRILHHNGSNTMFFAAVWIVPDENFAAVAATNIGGDPGSKACEDAIGSVLDRYIRNKPKE